MKATFSYAVRYHVTVHCLTPLRTADADGDTEKILRGIDGRYMLQGSSISGALRSWTTTHEGAALAETLFGTQNAPGSLIISDGHFSEQARLVIRPRLRIDGRTGSAANGGKFDLAHIGTGSDFVFTVCWLGEKDEASVTSVIERILAALHSGEILLGAEKSNGFGRVSLHVKKQIYDMVQSEDRERWLSEIEDGKAISLPDSGKKPVTLFTLKGTADSLLVKAAAAKLENGGSFTPNLTEAGIPVIPGSSIKGVIRARAEKIASFLNLPDSVTEALFGREARDDDNGQAGTLRFEDAMLTKSVSQKITRIRINRFTGGVMRGGLFVEEPVSGTLTLQVAVPADEEAGCMLLLYALRDLASGLYNLGSGGSIGRGFLQVEELTALTPDGRQVALHFDQEKNCSVFDPAELIPKWRQALEAKK